MKKGRLIIFEGADEVGKTTLTRLVVSFLESAGVRAVRFSFPGRIEGSLGKHVYELHNDPAVFGINDMLPEKIGRAHV